MDDGARIACWHGGQTHARPVLLLHGYTGSHGVMQALAGSLAPHRPVILYDARGHGASDPFRGRATMARLADDLATVIATWAPDGCDAVGLSMGALTFFEHFERHGGEGLHRLVCIDQSPRVPAGPDWPHGLSGRASEGEVAQLQAAIARDPRTIGRGWLRALWRSDERLMIKLAGSPDMLRGMPDVPASTLRLASDLLVCDWRQTVRHIHRPTLLLHGGCSIYPGSGPWLQDAMPDARLEVFERSGHGLLIQEPRRAANLVAQFLEVS